MVAKSRKEQVFEVCSHLYNKGYTERSQYTYRAMGRTCEELGYPRGNQQKLIEYRDEWLAMHLDKEQDLSLSTSADSTLLQSTLDALLKEQKQKMFEELEARFRAKFESLEAQNTKLLSTIDTREAELDEIKQKKRTLEDKLEGQQGYFDTLHKQVGHLFAAKEALTSERDVALEKAKSLEAKLEEQKETHQKQTNNLLIEKNESIAELQQQLKDLQVNHEQTMQSLIANFDVQRQEWNDFRQSLEAKLDQSREDLQGLKTDYARQELTVSLLERERGEFYQEFTVMRKQFEQMPKYQTLTKGQEELIGLVKAMNKQSSSLKSSKK